MPLTQMPYPLAFAANSLALLSCRSAISPVINAATSKMDMTKCIPSWRYMAAKRGQQFGGGNLGVIELPARIGSK